MSEKEPPKPSPALIEFTKSKGEEVRKLRDAGKELAKHGFELKALDEFSSTHTPKIKSNDEDVRHRQIVQDRPPPDGGRSL